MAIYRMKQGQKVKVSAHEVKQTIMKANNWTAQEYRKKYDIFKNKLRAYESFEGKKPESPVEVLYKQAQAKIRQGAKYKPSLKMQRIQGFTSVSITKGRQLATANTPQAQAYRQRRGQAYSDYTYKQFKGLIKNNSKAKEIYDNVKDPVQRERALTDYANTLKLSIKQREDEEEAEAIPFGETYGSDTAIDFDYSDYL